MLHKRGCTNKIGVDTCALLWKYMKKKLVGKLTTADCGAIACLG